MVAHVSRGRMDFSLPKNDAHYAEALDHRMGKHSKRREVNSTPITDTDTVNGEPLALP